VIENIDLEVADLVEDIEPMAEGNALGSFSSASTASCPYGCASTAGCIG